MAKSFAELLESPQVTAAEIIAALEDHASDSWPISDGAVLSLLEKVELTLEERNLLRQHAQTGEAAMNKKGDHQGALRYKNVIVYLDNLQ